MQPIIRSTGNLLVMFKVMHSPNNSKSQKIRNKKKNTKVTERLENIMGYLVYKYLWNYTPTLTSPRILKLQQTYSKFLHEDLQTIKSHINV